MLPTTPALPRSAANSRLGLERVGMTLVPGVIRAGQWVVVADPSHGEERGKGCCVSACLSAHPWRAAPPPSPTREQCDVRAWWVCGWGRGGSMYIRLTSPINRDHKPTQDVFRSESSGLDTTLGRGRGQSSTLASARL